VGNNAGPRPGPTPSGQLCELLSESSPDHAFRQAAQWIATTLDVPLCAIVSDRESFGAETVWEHTQGLDEQAAGVCLAAIKGAPGLNPIERIEAETGGVRYGGLSARLSIRGMQLGRVGVFAASESDLNGDSQRVLGEWSHLLAARLHAQTETHKLQQSLSQYERGFLTLDRQLRVLDVERQKLAVVLNNSEIGFLVINRDLQITWANPAMAYGLNASGSGFDILRQKCSEVICGSQQACDECPVMMALKSGSVQRSELTPSRTQRRLYTVAAPIRGASGSVEEVLLMVQDLSGLDALQRSEARYRLLFERSLDAIFMATPPDFKIVMANPATRGLLGYDQDEVEHMSLDRLHTAEEWPLLRAYYSRAIEGERDTPLDCTVVGRHGQTLWCNVIATPFDLDGQTVVMCTLRDITTRKKTEAALESSLSLLQGTLESTADGILVVDGKGTINSFNRKFLQMWRIPDSIAQKMDDDRALEYVLEQLSDPNGFVAKVRELYGDPEAESLDLLAFKDGRVFERYSKPRRIGGTVVGRVWSFRDITEREAAGQALRTRLQFEQLITSLSTQFINLTSDEIDAGIHQGLRRLGEFAAVDRSYIFLFSPDGTLMSNTHEWCAPGISPQMDGIQNVPVQSLPYFVRHMQKLEAFHVPRVEDLPEEAHAERDEFKRQDIRSVVVVPMIYGKSLIGFLGFDSVRRERAWDADTIALLRITGEIFANALSRKRTEAEKSSLEEQLRHSQKMEAVGTLAGGIAHDFNNILTGILGYADMLCRPGLGDEQTYKAAAVIHKAARRAAELTQQLLGFARKGKYQNVPVDLHGTVEEVIGLLSRTFEKNIVISRAFGADRACVLGDPVQIQQVILNLAVNARDAMPGGGTLMFETSVAEVKADHTRRRDDPKPGWFVKLTVSDTGCGIPDEVQTRIFEPFFTTKEQGKGTGMGLAMVYGIVKNHGGVVRVASSEGQGTRFEVLIPVASQGEIAALTPCATSPPTRGERILVVDDEEMVRGVLANMLEALGYEVVTAVDGLEAVEIYSERSQEFDLVILDMAMPRMGGRKCFLELKKINPHIKAVLSTGYALDETTQRVLDDGMVGFAQKPYMVHDLSQLVTRALRGETRQILKTP
jgi:PAS domain S-box-containing protein